MSRRALTKAVATTVKALIAPQQSSETRIVPRGPVNVVVNAAKPRSKRGKGKNSLVSRRPPMGTWNTGNGLHSDAVISDISRQQFAVSGVPQIVGSFGGGFSLLPPPRSATSSGIHLRISCPAGYICWNGSTIATPGSLRYTFNSNSAPSGTAAAAPNWSNTYFNNASMQGFYWMPVAPYEMVTQYAPLWNILAVFGKYQFTSDLKLRINGLAPTTDQSSFGLVYVNDPAIPVHLNRQLTTGDLQIFPNSLTMNSWSQREMILRPERSDKFTAAVDVADSDDLRLTLGGVVGLCPVNTPASGTYNNYSTPIAAMFFDVDVWCFAPQASIYGYGSTKPTRQVTPLGLPSGVAGPPCESAFETVSAPGSVPSALPQSRPGFFRS